MNVLRELNVDKKPRLTVLNKIDLVEDAFLVKENLARLDGSVAVSALQKTGVDLLLATIDQKLSTTRRHRRFLIPQKNPELVASLYARGNVIKTDYHQRDVYLEVLIEDRHLGDLKKYLLA